MPRNYLEALGEFWQLKEVDYIDGVEDLYVGKGSGGSWISQRGWVCLKEMWLRVKIRPGIGP